MDEVYLMEASFSFFRASPPLPKSPMGVLYMKGGLTKVLWGAPFFPSPPSSFFFFFSPRLRLDEGKNSVFFFFPPYSGDSFFFFSSISIFVMEGK